MAANNCPSVWTASQASQYSQPSFVSTSSSIDSFPSQIVGEEHDTFIPTPAEIGQIFHDGIKTWSLFLTRAEAIPTGLWPVKILDPYITLFDVPCLPAKMHNGMHLHGSPRWHLPRPDCVETTEPGDCDSSIFNGPRVTFFLRFDDPIQCGIYPDTSTILSGSLPGIAQSHAVLTLCWSYILSVRLFEMQGRQVRYSKHRIVPKSRCHGPAIYLDGASPALIRWLCAVLCCKTGWMADDKFFPPWAACLATNPDLVTTSRAPTKDLAAPSSSEATRLLLELCQLFDLNTDPSGEKLTALPPCRAGFLAALMFPFYRFRTMTPQFPQPDMRPAGNNKNRKAHDRRTVLLYLRDIRYFMSLSIHPPSLGSILWSALWQPDIDCNLVSPWLASFINVLDKIVNDGKLEIRVKVLALRRPRVGIWWLALFLLGDLEIIHWFRRYAETLMEKRASATLSAPDPVVSAWTGSKQSFLDYNKTKQYKGPSDLVSREDLLRCRLVFSSQNRYFASLSWRPFGHTEMRNVELELWPYLESDYTCVYDSFAWYQDGKLLHVSRGFRSETGRHVKCVPDDLERRRSETNCRHDIKLEPSRVATLDMLSRAMYDATCVRHWANTALPATSRQHWWLRHWAGLDSWEISIKVNHEAYNAAAARPPSRFLLDWIRRQTQDSQSNV